MADPFPKPPEQTEESGWVSFSFNSEAGYEKISGTVHGSPEFVAEKFGIKDFDGKISTLMNRAVLIDTHFKKQYKSQEDERPKA